MRIRGAATACSSLASLSSPAFKVEAAEWVAATLLPAGPAGATVEVPDHCLFRVMIDARPSTRRRDVLRHRHRAAAASQLESSLLLPGRRWPERCAAARRWARSERSLLRSRAASQ